MPSVPKNLTKKRGLAIIFTEANHARLHGGLSLALAAAAIGRPVRLFFQAEAVCALQVGRRWTGDKAYKASGMPQVTDLMNQAAEIGIARMACESGLHLCGISRQALDAGV